MTKTTKNCHNWCFPALAMILLLVICFHEHVEGQRNLLHLKQDLEFRLGTYNNQRRIIDNILASSIYPSRAQTIHGSSITRFSGAKVRFTDLIITGGSLIFDRQNALPTVRILVNKTRDYVGAKMNELYSIRSQLEDVKHQINSHQYIYKGHPSAPILAKDDPIIIPGTRVFKQFIYGRSIDSFRTELAMINYTNVDHVINETYMANTKLGLLDPQSRLFFEGKKTFWKTTFTGNLKSGCCHRMRPIHTDRMMTRFGNQEISAPVMFQTNDLYIRNPVLIHNLTAGRLYNRILAVGLVNNGFVYSSADNTISLEQLIHLKMPYQLAIPKTLIFKEVVLIDEARLYSPANDRGLVLGVSTKPNLVYNLNHDNYLLRFASSTRNISSIQFLAGSLIINGASLFTEGIEANFVNGMPNFDRFVRDNIVRIDRPSFIRGPVQFNGLPTIFAPPVLGTLSQAPRNVLIMIANKNLEVGLLNGMRVPQDLVFLAPSPLAYGPGQIIRVRGSRRFTNQVSFDDLNVYQTVNDLLLPQEVIPLHLNDLMSSVGGSNLWFLDGISAQHVTIHNGQFDDIVIRDSDAQNIIMRSVFVQQPDGTHLVRAPLQITHLQLLSQSPDQGLLNGFRPQNLLELGRHPFDAGLYGQKRFMAPVEAADCVFNDMNELANWPNHLIRIDRPNLIQNVYSRLAFTNPPLSVLETPGPNGATLANLIQPIGTSSLDVGHLRVDFYTDNSLNHHFDNWNFSPEFYILDQALNKATFNNSGGRYRILDQVRLIDVNGNPIGRVNGISLQDIVTLDSPFRFTERHVLVGKVTVEGNLKADRIHSNYPLDVMDLVQFNQFRVPTMGSKSPIRLNNLVLGPNNQANFVQSNMVNGIKFNDFVTSIMSLTRPQLVDASLAFQMPINFEGLLRTGSSVNNVKSFKELANHLKNAKYTFEDGLQCNSVSVISNH